MARRLRRPRPPSRWSDAALLLLAADADGDAPPESDVRQREFVTAALRRRTGRAELTADLLAATSVRPLVSRALGPWAPDWTNVDRFFDQLDAQLRGVAHRGLDADLRHLVVWRRPGVARLRGRAPWRAVRLPATVLAAVSLAGAAIAATAVWRPIPGQPGLGSPRTSTAAAPPEAQLAVLGVLRRQQTPADRDAETRSELTYIGNTASGVRTAYIRLLSDRTGLGRAILVPVAQISQAAPSELPRTDALCLLVGDAAGRGAARRCFTTGELLAGRATLSLATDIFGVVPDAVAMVSIRFSNGATRHVAPLGNLFELAEPAGAAPAVMVWASATGTVQRFPP